MASKSKRARMAPQRNLAKTFMYWTIAVLVIKLIIIARIQPYNLKIRGTVSRLCAKTSGAASKTRLSRSRLPLKSGANISTPHPGLIS